MVVVVDGSIFYDGKLLGESNRPISDGVVNIEYEKPRVYVIE